MAHGERYTIGVISDTHGMLRREAVDALRGSDLIIHAGDVGNPMVIEELRKIAPVKAVRGNMDGTGWARELPRTAVVEVGDVVLYVLHEPHLLDLDPAAAGLSAVIMGHTHVPMCEDRDGVLFFNPGSAGPRRLDKPVALGRIVIRGARLDPEIIELAEPE